jgi:hypothetical protein
VRPKSQTIREVGTESHGSSGGDPRAQVFLDIRDPNDGLVISLQGFSDALGNADLTWKTGRKQASGTYTAEVVAVIISGYAYAPPLPDLVVFDIQ